MTALIMDEARRARMHEIEAVNTNTQSRSFFGRQIRDMFFF